MSINIWYAKCSYLKQPNIVGIKTQFAVALKKKSATKKISSELWFGPSEPLTTRFIYKNDFGFFQSQKKKKSLVKLPAFVAIDLQWCF